MSLEVSQLNLLLILIASLSWALLDITRKVLSARLPACLLAMVLCTGQVPFYLIWWMFEGTPQIEAHYPLVLCGSLLMGTVGFFFYLASFRRAPISLSMPYLCLAPGFSTLSALALGEVPTFLQSMGIVLVLVGGLLLYPRENDQSTDPKVKEGVLLMCSAAAAWGTSSTIDKIAIQLSAPAFHATITSIMGVLVYGMGVIWRGEFRQRAELRASKSLIALAVVFALFALGLQFAVIPRVHVGGFESTKRAVGVIASILGGRIFLSEKITLRKVGCGAIMAIGVVLATS